MTSIKPRSLITRYGAFEKTTKNATSHPNISSFKIAIEKEWNRISEEFIPKTFKSFRRYVHTILEKKKIDGHIECNLLFCVYLFFCRLFYKIEIDLVL